MRNPKRIPIILKHIPWFNFLQEITGMSKMDENLARLVQKVTNEVKDIEKFWKLCPDLRLTQVLVNLNLIPNTPGFWYYLEEDKWMIDNEYLEPRDICTWTAHYDSKMRRLRQPKQKLLKDLTTDHIKAILSGKGRVDKLPWCKEPFTTYLKNELKLRNGKEKISNTRRSRRKKA